MKPLHLTQDGFTAVELLITLFIASIFLFAGYQLYNQVTIDGENADNDAKLSNIVYEKAQAAGNNAALKYPNGCSTAAATTDGNTENIEGIGNVTFTTDVSCPAGNNAQADMFLVRVKASYFGNGATREVEHAIYAN